jgi:hypothetical protein
VLGALAVGDAGQPERSLVPTTLVGGFNRGTEFATLRGGFVSK